MVSPYRKVENGVVTDKIEYLTAYDEEKYVIAQANAEIDEKGRFTHDRVLARAYGDIRLVEPKKSTIWMSLQNRWFLPLHL